MEYKMNVRLQHRWCQIVEVSQEKDTGVPFDPQSRYGANASKVVPEAKVNRGKLEARAYKQALQALLYEAIHQFVQITCRA